MAVSNIPMVPRDGSVTILDLAGSNSYTVDYENGDVSGPGSLREDRIVVRDRGSNVAVRKGNDPVLTITFTVHLREFTNGSALILPDVAEFSGAAAGWSKTTDIAGDYNFVTLRFTGAKAALGDTANAVITYPGCILMWDWAEGEPDSITVTAECHIAPTRTGQA